MTNTHLQKIQNDINEIVILHIEGKKDKLDTLIELNKLAKRTVNVRGLRRITSAMVEVTAW